MPLTGITSDNHCSAREVTSKSLLAVPLEITVNSIAAVSPNTVGVVTGSRGMDWVAICPSSASIVQCLLQVCFIPIFANAPCCTCNTQIHPRFDFDILFFKK